MPAFNGQTAFLCMTLDVRETLRDARERGHAAGRGTTWGPRSSGRKMCGKPQDAKHSFVATVGVTL